MREFLGVNAFTCILPISGYYINYVCTCKWVCKSIILLKTTFLNSDNFGPKHTKSYTVEHLHYTCKSYSYN